MRFLLLLLKHKISVKLKNKNHKYLYFTCVTVTCVCVTKYVSNCPLPLAMFREIISINQCMFPLLFCDHSIIEGLFTMINYLSFQQKLVFLLIDMKIYMTYDVTCLLLTK
jgi:hypothetical protein